MGADDLLCSRSARSKTPLVGRAQWKINQPLSLEERRSKLGGSIDIHRHALIDSSCKSAVRLRLREGHGAQ